MKGTAAMDLERLVRDMSKASRLSFEQMMQAVAPASAALAAFVASLSAVVIWLPISVAPQDGTRLMLWDSVSKRPVFGSWRGDNPAITHYAAEPAGPAGAMSQKPADHHHNGEPGWPAAAGHSTTGERA